MALLSLISLFPSQPALAELFSHLLPVKISSGQLWCQITPQSGQGLPERDTTYSFVKMNVQEWLHKEWLATLFLALSVIFFALTFLKFLFVFSVLVAGLGARQRWRSFYGNSATKLPGQRSCGICDRSEEVHRVLHVCSVFHYARRRSPQPTQSIKDTWGQ